jgi:hypothetical protein
VVARLYADEDFPFPVVEELRRLGHDAATIQERGLGGQGVPDPAVLALAVAEDRAVLTRNRRHFIRLHAADPAHAGVIVCTQAPDFIGQARRVDAAVRAAGDLHGRLVRVNRPPP